MMTVVSFYTQNWLYEQKAKELRQRCLELGLASDIQERPDTGAWRTNTAIKPRYIREMLNRYEHILWLDCDGDLRQKPLLCLNHPPHADILACPHRTNKARDWHVGILSIRSNAKTKAFLDAWIQIIDDHIEHETTDEFAFIQLMKDHPEVLFAALPDKYHVLMINANKELLKDAVFGLGISRDGDKQTTYKSKDRLEYL